MTGIRDWMPVSTSALRITTRPSPNKLVAFQKEAITNTLGQFLADHHMTQARIAETEKYAHVTFFFNGGVEEPNPGEEQDPGEIPQGGHL